MLKGSSEPYQSNEKNQCVSSKSTPEMIWVKIDSSYCYFKNKWLSISSSIIKENGGDDNEGSDERQVFVNACGQLHTTDKDVFDCPVGSSVCEPSVRIRIFDN